MPVDVYLFSRDNVLKEKQGFYLGSLEIDPLLSLQKSLTIDNIKIFNFIDPYDETILNPQQIRYLISEIQLMRNLISKENKPLLDFYQKLKKILDFTLDIIDPYLLFAGD